MRIERRKISKCWLEPSDGAIREAVYAYGVRRLAAAIGKSPTYVSLWLSGKCSMGEGLVRKIVKETKHGKRTDGAGVGA